MTDSPTSKFRKIKHEQFYTPWRTAHFLYEFLIDTVGDNFDNFVEPSAGKGSFLACMPPDKRIGIDIDRWGWHYGSVGKDIVEQDFFNFVWPEGKTITIGNPPYGRRGKLAMKFLNISAENSDVVAFILPAIFSKFTFINRVHPYMHLKSWCNPVMEFETEEGKTVEVRSVFQIWQKSLDKRPKIVKRTECDHFTMTHRHTSRISSDELEQLKRDSTVAIQQVGGRVLSPEDVKRGSIWWIKGGDREIFEQIDFFSLHQHHLGAISLTKADIVERYLNIVSQKDRNQNP